MKLLSRSSIYVFLATLLCGVGFFGEGSAQYIGEDYCNHGDLMQQAFCVANRKETIVDLGNTKNAVGNEVIKGTTKINLDFDKETDTLQKNQSIIIRITQFILMLTIVLAVTMTIINGILYITKSGNGEDPIKTRWNLLYIAGGILLALFSVVIVNLLRSALNEETIEGGSGQETVTFTKTVVYVPSEGPTQNVEVSIRDLSRPVHLPGGWAGDAVGTEFKKTYTENVNESIKVEDMDGNLWSIPIEITRIEKVNCEKGRYYTVQPRGTVCNTIEYEGLTCYNECKLLKGEKCTTDAADCVSGKCINNTCE